jgi:hypothetical protein
MKNDSEKCDWIPDLSDAIETPRLLLVCGGDLLETFSTPGLWQEEDVRVKKLPLLPNYLTHFPTLRSIYKFDNMQLGSVPDSLCSVHYYSSVYFDFPARCTYYLPTPA